jgi:hypothetical protein
LPCLNGHTATQWLVDTLLVERRRIDRQIGDLLRSRDVLDDVIAEARTHASGPHAVRREPPTRDGDDVRTPA